MGTKPKICPAIIKAARNLTKGRNGDSVRGAARRLGLSESGLRKAMARRAGKRRVKEARGRPKCLGKGQVKKVIKLLDAENKKGFEPNAPYIRRRLRLSCSDQSVRRTIKKHKYKFKARIPKSTTCKLDRLVRKKFAAKCTPAMLKKIDLWIDQWSHAIPLMHTVPKSEKVWRKDKDKLKVWAVKPNPKFRAPTAKLLGGFSKGVANRPAKLIFCTPYKRMSQTEALRIWKKVIMPALKKHYPNKRTFLVQQDGEGALNAAAVREQLSAMGVTVAFRGGNTGPQAPARFCDFWPCETIWANRKKAVRKTIQKSRKWSRGVGVSATEPEKRAWSKTVLGVVRRVKRPFLQSLHDGMPKRLRKLRDAKGGPIPK